AARGSPLSEDTFLFLAVAGISLHGNHHRIAPVVHKASVTDALQVAVPEGKHIPFLRAHKLRFTSDRLIAHRFTAGSIDDRSIRIFQMIAFPPDDAFGRKERGRPGG